MLNQLFKKKSLEENPDKAIKAYKSNDLYDNDFVEIIIRTELAPFPDGPKTLDQIDMKCGGPLSGRQKTALYGAILKFIDEGLVEVNEDNGKRLYNLTRLGADEKAWPLSVKSLAEMVKGNILKKEADDRKMRPWAYQLYGERRNRCCEGDDNGF